MKTSIPHTAENYKCMLNGPFLSSLAQVQTIALSSCLSLPSKRSSSLLAMALGTMARFSCKHKGDFKLPIESYQKEVYPDDLSNVLHMISGDGENSYAKNSSRQGSVFKVMQPAFYQLIQSFPMEDHPYLVRIADFGCATGMNTISEVDFAVKTIKFLCAERGLTVPQVQVFFNDLPSNDFNDLFMLLKSVKPDYLAAGVPGTFYDVLFPRGSIHICFSIMALHWLSQIPVKVMEVGSPVYNRGKVWINGSKAEVAKAYAEQSQQDLRQFFHCRAQEIVSGGVMFLCAMGRPDSEPPERQVAVEGEFCGADFEAAWDDLISEGIITAEMRDGFNLPWYFPNAEETREAIEASSAFEIAKLEVRSGVPSMGESEFEEWATDIQSFGKKKSRLVRSFVGSLVQQKIGLQKCNALFERFETTSSELLEKGIIRPSRFATCIMAALVKK